jgi:3'-phosphoadenosine 5'-phosphosulfate sulfotransferase (PAPS reductase)/FAD synthetase
MKKIRHLLGISGGKDSAALAIYLKDRYPQIDIEYYSCDTGKELEETYQLIDNLEIYLGKKIVRLRAFGGSDKDPFDHKLKTLKGFLPSQRNRWCTKYLKLDPFEKFAGNDSVISYVGIRGDENREGYISKKQNIQSIFPFRKNIWSEDVISKALSNFNILNLLKLYEKTSTIKEAGRFIEVLKQPVSLNFPQPQKLNLLLNISIKEFNYLIFSFLKTTNYPLANEENYQLIDNEDILVREDIFNILRKSGVGVPKYYDKVEFDIDNKKGIYFRSRSGCYFCFFQQKIEWIWLYEQHKELFNQALNYEKEGYTWNQDEALSEMIKPDRIQQIKEEYLRRTSNDKSSQSPFLVDILSDAESEGCASCFI